MIVTNTYLFRGKLQIRRQFYKQFHNKNITDTFILSHINECFVHIDDAERIQRYQLIDNESLMHDIAIVIQYHNRTILKHNIYEPHLWESFTSLIEQYLSQGESQVMLDYEPFILKLTPVDSDKIRFIIAHQSREYHYEYKDGIYVDEILPEQPFIFAVLDGIQHYFNKLSDYGVFSEQRADMNSHFDNKRTELRKRYGLLES